MNDGFNHPTPEPVNPEPSYPFAASSYQSVTQARLSKAIDVITAYLEALDALHEAAIALDEPAWATGRQTRQAAEAALREFVAEARP